MTREEDVTLRVRLGIAGWRGPSGAAAGARYRKAAVPRMPAWIRPLAGVLITVAIFAAGISGALGIQSVRALLTGHHANASTPSATAEPTAAPESPPAVSPEPSPTPTAEPTPVKPSAEATPPENPPTPPAEHPTPPPEH